MYLIILKNGEILTTKTLSVEDYEDSTTGILNIIRHSNHGFDRYVKGEWIFIGPF